jgi:hypothetical protein
MTGLKTTPLNTLLGTNPITSTPTSSNLAINGAKPTINTSLPTFGTKTPIAPNSNIGKNPNTGQYYNSIVNGSVQTAPITVPVNKTPAAHQVLGTNPIQFPTNTSNVDNSLRATSDAAMATPPTPAPNYYPSTGFLTQAGLSTGAKPVQPNDPAGGSNSNSLINNYLGGANSNPSSINNGNLIPDTSGNQNNANLSQYQGLNAQLGTETSTRNNLNSQFGVDTKQQNYIDAFNQYQSKSLSYNQQVNNLYNQPGVTREQADQQVKEISRQNNADLANLAVVTQAAQGNYTTALDIVQRKMDAQFQPVQAQIDNLKAIVQSPNSNLTASQQAQINANMFGLQNNLTNTKNALSTGSQTLIQNGLYTADIGKQLDAAQTPEQVNSIISNAMTGAGLSYNPNGTTGGQSKESNLSQTAQNYVDHSSDGIPYVDAGRLANMTDVMRNNTVKEYANAGIRVLDSADVQALGTIDGAKQDLSLFSETANKLLSPGLLGRIKGMTTNQLSQFAQTNPDWRQFQTLRSGIIKSIQGIASGAPGLRVTGAELAAGAESLPNSADNLESAQTAVNTFKKLLDVNRNVLLRGNASQATNNSGGNTGTGITNSKGQVTSASF